MKKYFFSALAAVAMLNLTSCLSEEEVNLTKGETEKGYINLNVSTDNKLETRGVVTATASELESWYVDITGGDTYSGQIGTSTTGLAAKAFAPATNYSASVRSHQDLSSALALNDGFGVPYYTGATTENFTVSTGQTATPSIVCGKAKNAAIVVNVSNTFSSISGATINTFTVSGSNSRTITFIDNTANPAVDNTARTAYFDAETVNYSINYTINSNTKTYPGSITLAAGTLNTLAVSSNSNGSITLNITYDNELGIGQTQTITIDAATGNASVN